jgi:hypothetical protein
LEEVISKEQPKLLSVYRAVRGKIWNYAGEMVDNPGIPL